MILDQYAMTVKTKHQDCTDVLRPVRDTLEVINGKWKLLIIASIGGGNDRFTAIQDSIPGITPKVLAKELKDLEMNKLIRRVVVDDYPIRILYSLEEYADTLTPIIYAMRDWGVAHRKRIVEK